MVTVLTAATVLLLPPTTSAQSLAGTWQSKSKTVITGPSFYDAETDTFTEPRLPGVSYAFTTDGHYESAAYVITPNPATPQCPSAVLQWQHGSYTLGTDGSLQMVPISVDSRQLLSAPCGASGGVNTKAYGKSVLTRYSYNDTMQSYRIDRDSYYDVYKLTLNRKFGDPVQPLYYVGDGTPAMVPTTTLHPTASAASRRRRFVKRALDSLDGVVSHGALDVDKVWWMAVSGVCIGAVGVLVF